MSGRRTKYARLTVDFNAAENDTASMEQIDEESVFG